MALKLMASGDDRAFAIRDHLVPLVRDHGKLELQEGSVRLTVLETGPWTLNHWTPFNELAAGEASSPGYRHALERQHGSADLPYGLDVLHNGTKVLSLVWADNGTSEIITFVPGSWEAGALRL